MKQYQAMTFVLTEDEDTVFIVTTHNGGLMSIHTCTPREGFALEITQAQAEDLTGKLQKAIIDLIVAKRTEGKKEEV